MLKVLSRIGGTAIFFEIARPTPSLLKPRLPETGARKPSEATRFSSLIILQVYTYAPVAQWTVTPPKVTFAGPSGRGFASRLARNINYFSAEFQSLKVG